MNKPICPDCGGDCELEDMASPGEGDPYMVYKCQGFCKTWVYRPDWETVDDEEKPNDDPQQYSMF